MRTVVRQFRIALGSGLAQSVVVADIGAHQLPIPQIDWLAVQIHPFYLFLPAIVVAVHAEGRRLNFVNGLALNIGLEVPLRLQYKLRLLSGAVSIIEVATEHFGRVHVAKRIFLPLLLIFEQSQPPLILLRNLQTLRLL